MFCPVSVPHRPAVVSYAFMYRVVESGIVASVFICLTWIKERMVKSCVENCLHVLRCIYLQDVKFLLPLGFGNPGNSPSSSAPNFHMHVFASLIVAYQRNSDADGEGTSFFEAHRSLDFVMVV